MKSGNYIIGKDFSLKAYEMYVQPLLNEQNIETTDKMIIKEEDSKKVLVGLKTTKKEDLFINRIINDVLIEASKQIKTDNKKIDNTYNTPQKEYIAWDFNIISSQYKDPINGTDFGPVGIITVIGEYSQPDTASKNFSLIAQKYLLNEVDLKTYKVKRELKSFINSKISEL